MPKDGKGGIHILEMERKMNHNNSVIAIDLNSFFCWTSKRDSPHRFRVSVSVVEPCPGLWCTNTITLQAVKHEPPSPFLLISHVHPRAHTVFLSNLVSSTTSSSSFITAIKADAEEQNKETKNSTGTQGELVHAVNSYRITGGIYWYLLQSAHG